MKKFRIGLDIDGMLTSYGDFFQMSIPAWQKMGSEVGILTSRPEHEKKHIAEAFLKAGVKFDFLLFKPDKFKSFPNGVWKAVMCRFAGIDILFDDMQHDDPAWVSDFTATIGRGTVPFTTYLYNDKLQEDGNDMTIEDYVKKIIEYLKKNPKG